MKFTSNTKPLIFIIIFLLIIDVALLFFFILKNKPEQRNKSVHHSGMYYSLKNDVGFSTNQLDKYHQIREQQMGEIKYFFNQVRDSKTNLYELLYSADSIGPNVIAHGDSIAQNQKTLDLQMFAYFKKIRNICTPEQLPRFDSTIKKTVMRMIGRKGRSRGRHDSTK